MKLISVIRYGYFALATIWVICLAGCGENCFSGSGQAGTLMVPVEDFTELEVGNKFRVELLQDTSKMPSVTIFGGENLIDGVSIESKGSRLVLKDNNGCGWTRDLKKRITVRVNVKRLQLIQLDGAAELVSVDTIRGDELKLNHAAAGDARLKLDYTSMNATITHVGDLFLEGRVGVCPINLYDYGTVDARTAEIGFCYLFYNGPRDVHLRPEKELGVALNGTGTVYYYREPWKIEIYSRKRNGKLVRAE